MSVRQTLAGCRAESPRPCASAALRLRAALALLGACFAGLLPGCGEAEDAPGPRFPIRQLEAAGAAPEEGALISDDLDSLDGWWALSVATDGTAALLPAEASPQVQAAEGLVTVQADTALIRPVRMRDALTYLLRVRMNGPQALPGTPCPQVQVLPAGATGTVRLTPDAPPAAAEALALATLVGEGARASRAEWMKRPDLGSDLPVARLFRRFGDGSSGERQALVVIGAWGGPLEVDHVSMALAPELRHGYDPSTEAPEHDDEIRIEGMKLSGEWRLSALVPAGRTLQLPITVPEGAVDVILGASLEPGSAPGARCDWTLTLRPGGQVLGTRSEVVGKSFAPRFADTIFPWPADVQGPVTIEFFVQGNAGMIFGQPKVRGPERPDAPSLLFVSIDTLRADHLGFLGYPRPTTPYLDELARDAAVFTNVTAVASYTLPTHATIFTGLFPPRHMALDTSDRLDAERTPTLARLLADAGFHTAGFTGGGFVSVDYGFAAGFDRYTTVDPVAVPPYLAVGPDGKRPDRAQVDQARSGSGLKDVFAWIQRQGARRWFAFVHTFATHEYDPPEEDRILFERPLDLPPDFTAQSRLNARPVDTDPPTRAELDRLIDLYDATIHHVDRRLQDLIEALRRNKLLENTIIVVTSDHGEEFLEHGKLRHNGSLYQELVHVPLLIDLPGPGPALRIDRPVSQADILPTLLELLGQEVPPDLDGHSLAPLLRGTPEAIPATPIFGHLERVTHARSALRWGDWKVIHSDTSPARLEPAPTAWELYDLATDPGETRDLSLERPDEMGRMEQILEELNAWMQLHRGTRQAAVIDDDVRQRLVELGYVEAAR